MAVDAHSSINCWWGPPMCPPKILSIQKCRISASEENKRACGAGVQYPGP